MRRILAVVVLMCVLVGGLWLLQNYDHLTGSIQRYIENGEFATWEVRFSPDQIAEAHSHELLATPQHSLRQSSLKFQPHLMLDVKYLQGDKKSREGVLFWSLVDGEIVIDTATWEKTHGFEDAINANASRNDFKLMNSLAKNRGRASLEQLQKDLHLEKETLQEWVNQAVSKHLIVQKGNDLQLHLQDPKILIQPETTVSQPLVTKSYDHTQLMSKKYSSYQIQKTSKAAFGDDFKIRETIEVFLPVYSIEILNPDGSVRTTYWNALSGQRIYIKR